MALFQGPIVGVGKIAGEAEYIRAETEAGALFEAWLDEGFEAGFERWGDEWRGAVRRGTPCAFVWWSAEASRFEGPLCGVLAPSRDAVGRDYPLAVFGHTRGEVVERAPHVLLLALGEFLDQVWRVIDLARSTPMTRSALRLQLLELPCPREDEAETAATEYDAWCQAAPVREGWNAVLPAPDGPGRIANPVAEIERGGSDGLLRLPARGGAGAVALWLDVAARVLGAGNRSAYWSPDNHSLIVAPGSSPVSVVGALWAPAASASVHTEMRSGQWIEAESVATDLSMAEFLASLGAPSRVHLHPASSDFAARTVAGRRP